MKLIDTSHYRYQELTSSGEIAGMEYLLNWREVRIRVAIAAPRYSLPQLNHMRALLHAAPGHPVDLVQWNWDKTAIEWSARLLLPVDVNTPLTPL